VSTIERIRLVVSLAVLLVAPGTFAMGIFEAARDIGDASGAGSTQLVGYAEVDGRVVGQYLITASSGNIGGNQDQFYFAYRRMSGPMRLSARFQPVSGLDGSVLEPWSEYGVMIRASGDPAAVNYCTTSYEEESLVRHAWRDATGAGSSDEHLAAGAIPGAMQPVRLGIQRVLIGGEIPVVESLVDWGRGAGWERVGTLAMLPDLPEEVLVGLCVTSHSTGRVAQVMASDVVYETRVELVGRAPAIAVVPAAGVLAAAPSGTVGLQIRTTKAVYTERWGRAEMNKLLDFGCTGPICQAPGLPILGTETGERVSMYVNLHDSGDRGAFSAANGFPDESFPGIDAFQSPTADPAGGDEDNSFATEVTAVVYLTVGFHLFAVNDDDGTIMEVGGIEIGRSGEWKDASNTDFIFQVGQEGYYPLRARHLAGTGAAALELHEVVKVADGTWKRILLGDVSNGGSPVFSAP